MILHKNNQSLKNDVKNKTIVAYNQRKLLSSSILGSWSSILISKKETTLIPKLILNLINICQKMLFLLEKL